ncbi:hypothetical protein B0H94_12012 [Salsuginibacillus halophilus]|uniref:Uncharacterized protein n=1 Tax=Salsuginibacillus halophilus TaxID=517424 RepID=A0A2P8H4W2_9BACI|nr:hypothetical protein [Salsuginibacillus halophilus]PSL41266.1 hypothetical protein B0H94_12012 [Salsuginibacillus halophilus]
MKKFKYAVLAACLVAGVGLFSESQTIEASVDLEQKIKSDTVLEIIPSNIPPRHY